MSKAHLPSVLAVVLEKDIPYGGFGASAGPAVRVEGFNLKVGDKSIEKNGTGFNWPGYDLLDCIYGWYDGPTNIEINGWPTVRVRAV